MTDILKERNELTIWLRVKPKSRREGLTTSSSGELCLSVHAPPAEGLANEATIRFLADALGVPKASIEIVSGKRARRKLIRVTGAPDALKKLQALGRDRGRKG